jgi:pimeloyl-ACP methyl ester carboxylesterase
MDTAVPVEALTQEILIRVEDRYAAMFVRIWRPAAAPPRGTVFCLHSFTGNGSDFDYLAAFLCRNGYLVICPDMPGRGRSGYLEKGADYNSGLYLKCLRALGEFAGKENHFIGNAWGGSTILLFLYLTGAKAAKVVLNDVPMRGGKAVDEVRSEIIRGMVRDRDAAFETREAGEDYVRAGLAFPGPVEELVLQRRIESRIVPGPRGYRLAYDPAMAENFDAMTGREYDLFAIAAKVDARLLLIYGRDSRFVERGAIRQARLTRPDVWYVDNIDAGSPPSLMTLDQALLILGFLSAV